MDFRRRWIILALLVVLGAAGAVAGRESQRAPVLRRPIQKLGLETLPPAEFHRVTPLDGGAGYFEAAQSVAFDSEGNIAAAGTLVEPEAGSKFAVARFSSAGNLLWVRTLQGDAPGLDNAALAVAVDNHGNIAAGGYVHNELTALDIAVMKWKPNGDPLWPAPQIIDSGNGLDDGVNALKVDSVGNVIAAGYFSAEGGEGGQRDFVVTKFAGSDGARGWTYVYQNPELQPDEALCLEVERDPAKVAAQIQEDVVAGGYVTTGDDTNFFVVKLNGGALTQGDLVRWEASLILDVPRLYYNWSYASSVAIDSAGDVIAAGTIVDEGGPAFAVVKLTGADGLLAWPDTEATPEGMVLYRTGQLINQANDVVVDGNDDVVAVGVTASTEAFAHMTVLKIRGVDGTTAFVREFNGTASEGYNEAHAVALLPGNHIVVAGTLRNIESDDDLTAIALKPDGTPIWRRTLNGTGNYYDAAFDVAVDPFGNVAVAGTMTEEDTGGDFTVALVDQMAPITTSSGVVPTMHSSAGGLSSIGIELAENVAMGSAVATITFPDTSTTQVTLIQTGSFSPQFPRTMWTGAFTFPSHSGPQPAVYNVHVTAVDLAGNVAITNLGTVTVQGDAEPPVIDSCLVDPAELTNQGGVVTIEADVTDNVGVATVVAHIQDPAGHEFDAFLEQYGEKRFSTTYFIAPNYGTSAEVYSFTLEAIDGAGNSSALGCGSVTVQPVDSTPPTLTDCQVTPRLLPDTGGTVAFSTKAEDNVRVASVQAIITLPNNSTDTVDLYFHTPSGEWCGNYFVPANSALTPLVYRVRMEARDDANNGKSEDCGTFTVAGTDAADPVVSSCLLEPTTLPPSGGAVAIEAEATDDSGSVTVTARVTRPDGTTATVPLPATGADSFAGVFVAPPNSGPADAVYTVFIIARDGASNVAVHRCGTFTVLAPDVTGPVFKSRTVTPAYRSSAGGPFNIAAEVEDDRGVSSVAAKVTGPESFAAFIPLTLNGGIYEGVFNAPANTSGVDEVYQISLEALDTSANATVEPLGTVAVLRPDSEKPVLLHCDVSPRSLLSPGGVVRFTGRATDNAGIDYVEVKISNPDATFTVVRLSHAGGDSYIGEITAPSNPGPGSQVYGVEFAAVDTSGNVTTMDCGTYTVAPPDDQAPTIVDCDVDRRLLLAAGGPVRITATVTDDAGVDRVTAVITRPDNTTTTVTLQPQGGDQYAGTFVVPANTGSAPQVYQVEIRARDTSGNQSTASCGTVTVDVPDTEAPVISGETVTPIALGGNGGTVQISADVTDNVSVTSVVAEIGRPDGTTILVPLTSSGGSRYSAGFYVPANPGVTTLEYRIRLRALDPSGNVATRSLGPVTVDGPDRAAPVLENGTLSPNLLPFTGGAVNVTVDARDNVGVTGVRARILRGGAVVAEVDLAAGTPPAYSATITAPANRGSGPVEYFVEVEGRDAAGNARTVSIGSFTVSVDTVAPEILACNRTPASLPSEGGKLTVTATVVDSIPLQGVFAVVTAPDGTVRRVPLDRVSGDNFAGQVEIPANTDPSVQEYTVAVEARDIAGNSAVEDCGNVAVALADGGRLELSVRKVKFGRVRFGTRIRRQLVIRNRSRGSRLAGTISTLGEPFSVRVERAGRLSTAVSGLAAGEGTVFSVAPGDTLFVSIEFAPREIANYRDDLVISTSDPRKRQVKVRVSGVGCRNGRRGDEIRD